MANLLRKVLREEQMTTNFVWFYAIGILLFALPFTREIFISIIPLSLLVVIGAIFYFHKDWSVRTLIWFVFIFVSSFLLEMEGVNTGNVFGEYSYDKGMGWQLNHTPLIIGLNWLFLVYASHDIAVCITPVPFQRVLYGSLLMLIYDVVMEAAAPRMHMWSFSQSYPPLSNFLTWFVASFIFHLGFELLNIRTDNPPARTLFGMQIVFFLCIILCSAIFPS